MQKSIASQNMANLLMFHLPNRVQYLPVFVYSTENFLISNLSSQLIFSILLSIDISKASLSSSVCLSQRPRFCCIYIQCYTPNQAFHYSLLWFQICFTSIQFIFFHKYLFCHFNSALNLRCAVSIIL